MKNRKSCLSCVKHRELLVLDHIIIKKMIHMSNNTLLPSVFPSPHPLISVIIPVYCTERYLNCCIHSIVNQTYQNLEIILIDDGSTDKCPQICDLWAKKDKRIRVIHQKNHGQAHARNIGIECSTGFLIGFVDSDDWLEPTMYETLYKRMLEANADVSMITEVLEYPNAHQVYLYEPDVHLIMSTSESFKYINLPGYSAIGPWNKLIKRSTLNNIRFPETWVAGEDYEFTYAVLAASKCTTFDSFPLYHYRQIVGSVSNTAEHLSMASYEAAVRMVDLVRQRFPEQLPYAFYGLMRNMASIYDQAIVTGHVHETKWRKFGKHAKNFIARYLNIINRSVHLPWRRRLQLHVMGFSLLLYRLLFMFYKRSHSERSR